MLAGLWGHVSWFGVLSFGWGDQRQVRVASGILELTRGGRSQHGVGSDHAVVPIAHHH